MLANPRKKAFAAFAAVVGGMVGLVWPAAVAEVLVRAAGVGLIVVGAIWIFDLVGASAWVSEREQRRGRCRVTPRRLALGGTTGVAMLSLVLLVGGMSFVRAVRAPHLDRMSIKDSRLQRLRVALRSPARPGDLRRDPQRDVGQRRRLLLRPPDRGHRSPSSAGACGPSCSTSTTAGSSRARAHRLPRAGRQGGVRRGAGTGREDDARATAGRRPGLRPGRRRARAEGPQGLPLPPVLRARRDLAQGRVRRPPRLPPGQPQRGGDPRAGGPRRARGRRRRARGEPPGRPGLHVGPRHPAADPPGDDQEEEERADHGRAPRRRPALVPGRLRSASCRTRRTSSTRSPSWRPRPRARWAGAAPRAPLLLINHWLDTGLPNPNDAAKANAHRRPRRAGRRLRASGGSASRRSWPSTSTPGATS